MFLTKNHIVIILSCLPVTILAQKPYQYDPNDFASQVVYYDAGQQNDIDYINWLAFNDPCTALGRPTVDTTGDNDNIPVPENVPVVGIYPPFRSFEVVTIGNGGKLILKFNHKVSDDKNNPYGMDFIVFGNTQQIAGGLYFWDNNDPNLFSIESSYLITDPGKIYVSQTGYTNDINDANQWFAMPTDKPYADTWAPTFGRLYDPCEPDTSIGAWNLWWGNPTNPTIPIDPNLTPDDFLNHTVAYMSKSYGQSAGGTSFDIKWLDPNDYEKLSTDPNTGEKWIQYICINGNENYTPEIDAVSDVACCGDYKHPFPNGDTNFDCKVDLNDLYTMSLYWADTVSGPNDPANDADLYKDNKIDFRDFAVLSATYMECNWDCNN